jgi:hypothetical protein
VLIVAVLGIGKGQAGLRFRRACFEKV